MTETKNELIKAVENGFEHEGKKLSIKEIFTLNVDNLPSDKASQLCAYMRAFLKLNTASDQEVVKFLIYCHSRGLNPLYGDAYLIPFRNQDGSTSHSIIIDYHQKIGEAMKDPRFNGMDSGFSKKTFKWKPYVSSPAKDVPIFAWCKIWVKNVANPIITKIKFEEFAKNNSQWGKMPFFMIEKCAISAGLSRAFPNMFKGVYIKEESQINEKDFIEGSYKVETKANSDNIEKQKDNPPFGKSVSEIIDKDAPF